MALTSNKTNHPQRPLRPLSALAPLLGVAFFLTLGGRCSTALAADERPLCALKLGLAASGSTGLFDLPLADPGCPWQLRIGGFAHGFVQYNYLITDDRNEQISGAVQLSATLGANLEAWLQIGSHANRNLRPTTDTNPSTQPTLALGRTAFGLKLHSPWGQLGHVALHAQARVHSGPDDFGPSFSSIDGGIELLGSLDLGLRWPRLPLRLSARAGYLHDRSASVLAGLDCMASGGAECLAARLIYTTAYAVGQPRVELGLGADLRFAIGNSLWLGPTLSYGLSVVTSDGDAVLRAQFAMQAPAIPSSQIDDRVAQQLTIGARMVLPWAISIDLGMQVALSSWGYAMGAKLPQLAGFGGFTFALDLVSRSLASESNRRDKESRRAAELERPAVATLLTGVVRGVVRDAHSRAPMADAVVRFIGSEQNALLTDDRGTYQSGPLSAGSLTIEASRGDHQTMRAVAVIRPGEAAIADLELPSIPRLAPARLWVELQDEVGAVSGALATLARQGQGPAHPSSYSPTHGTVVDLAPQSGGLYAAVAPGTWLLRVDATGYLSREQLVVLPAGEERRLTVLLSRRPPTPRARLGADEIQLGEPLGFSGEPQRLQLTAAGARLLDEVIDLLIHHPELRQVRMDNMGEGGEQPLIAVRDYLVQNGIAPERVIAVETRTELLRGHGPRVILRVVR